MQRFITLTCVAGYLFSGVGCAWAYEEVRNRNNDPSDQTMVIEPRPVSRAIVAKPTPSPSPPLARPATNAAAPLQMRPPIFAERNLVGAGSIAITVASGKDASQVEPDESLVRSRPRRSRQRATKSGWSDAFMKRMLNTQ